MGGKCRCQDDLRVLVKFPNSRYGDAAMSPTRSRLEEEILEQGKVLAGRTGPGWESAAAAAAALRRDDVDYVMVAARGTSDNAARYAQYLLGTEARLTVGLAAPWLYAHEAPPLL